MAITENKGMFSSESNEWYTPQKLFDMLDNEFKFNLDPCANDVSYKCDKWYGIEDNGLVQDWGGHNVFVNPPYGREIKKWIEKSYKESLKDDTVVVMLIPSRTDTKYWHKFIFPYASSIRFVKGRLKFGDGKGSAPFPSAVIVFDKTKNKNECETLKGEN